MFGIFLSNFKDLFHIVSGSVGHTVQDSRAQLQSLVRTIQNEEYQEAPFLDSHLYGWWHSLTLKKCVCPARVARLTPSCASVLQMKFLYIVTCRGLMTISISLL